MAHGDAVIHGDGIELAWNAAGLADGFGHPIAQILQMHMPRYELGVGIDHGNDGLAKLLVLHAGGAPEGARAGHVAALGGGIGTQRRHGELHLAQEKDRNIARPAGPVDSTEGRRRFTMACKQYAANQ